MAFLARALLAGGMLWILSGSLWARRTLAQTLESDVKAAFLYNFTKYVEWPSAAFQDSSDPFRICVLSEPEFALKVREIIEGERSSGRPLELVQPELTDVQRCHILFVGRQYTDKAGKSIAALSGRPVLIVGESPKFLEHGGAILLVVDQNRVRFDIDLQAATRSGLTVRSNLLRVARNVREVQRR